MKIKWGLLFLFLSVMSVFGIIYLKDYFLLEPSSVARAEVKNAEALSYALRQNPQDLFDYSGELMDMAQFENILASKKKVILHFWASWCDPCINEMPDLIDFAENDGAIEAYRVILVSQDVDLESLQKFAKVFPKIRTALFFQIWDKSGLLARHLKIDRLPATVVIDENSQIKIHEGVQNWRDM